VNEVKFKVLDRLHGRAFFRAPVIEAISDHFHGGASFFVPGTEVELYRMGWSAGIAELKE
jgi:hypothetical protein